MKIQVPDEAGAAFQMAPMIDVVFLLIIFFMVAADMNQQERVPVEIPLASNAERPEDPSGRGTITVKPNGDLFAGAQPVTLEQLSELARIRLAENPNFKLFLRADRATPHEHVRAAMVAAAEPVLGDIIFATYTSE